MSVFSSCKKVAVNLPGNSRVLRAIANDSLAVRRHTRDVQVALSSSASAAALEFSPPVLPSEPADGWSPTVGGVAAREFAHRTASGDPPRPSFRYLAVVAAPARTFRCLWGAVIARTPNTLNRERTLINTFDFGTREVIAFLLTVHHGVKFG